MFKYILDYIVKLLRIFKIYNSHTINHNRALTLIHERSCEYAFFKFIILCALQPPFPNLSFCLSFSSHTYLMGYSEKKPYGQRQNPNSFFINQRPSSWFLFYLYLYFIITSHNNNQ